MTAPLDLRPIRDLLALVTDPAATAKRVEELQAASDQAQKSVDEARAKLEAQELDQQAKLAAAADEHSRRLKKERDEFEKERDEQHRSLVAREAREARLARDQAAVKEERARIGAEAVDGRAQLNAARVDLERSAQMRGIR
jgi:hypothetical protein